MGYNATTNDPFRHNRSARRRRDRRIDNALAAVGTQPFRAVDKIGNQVDVLSTIQDAINSVLDRIPSVSVTKNNESATAGHTTWTTVVSVNTNRSVASMTKVAINAVGQAVFNQNLSGATDAEKATAADTKVYVRILINDREAASTEAARSGSGDSWTYTAIVSGMDELSGVGDHTSVELQVRATSIIGFSGNDTASVAAYATYSA